ncbi:MAG: hypothetical protein NC206_11250 [Bacteroides sp.]|nr:hypothetical protein [Roseburia sp.]MCM1347644.1 hypothetical protein [Bacteroides sp.]MCM1422077.1 hypothetical protein [Bacteroides sp.]
MRRISRMWMTMVVFMWVAGCVYGQKLHDENATIVGIFRELDSMFPKKYLVRQSKSGTIYDLNYYFKDENDRMQHDKVFKNMFGELDKLRALHKYVETIDTIGIQLTKYLMSVYSENPGQIDYVMLEVGNKKLSFHYTANYFADDSVLPFNIAQEDDICRELENLFDTYIKRKGVQTTEVTYGDNDNSRYYVTYDKKYNHWKTKAVKYAVPKCTEKDYKRFYELFQEYVGKYDVYVASNDVFWEYEETGLAFVNRNGKIICFGAALKADGTLFLVRSEGGNLPRLWAEDNSSWDYNCKLRSAYYRIPNN